MRSLLRPRKEDFELQLFEKWWSSNYNILLARGYRLRDRYNQPIMDAWLVHNEIDDGEARRRGLLDMPVRK